jgi:hypothetical protein
MPPDLAALREVIRKRAYLLTSHASHRAVERNIGSRDIEEAILTGIVIEDYPEDKVASCWEKPIQGVPCMYRLVIHPL